MEPFVTTPRRVLQGERPCCRRMLTLLSPTFLVAAAPDAVAPVPAATFVDLGSSI
jgi:hypothetical protein